MNINSSNNSDIIILNNRSRNNLISVDNHPFLILPDDILNIIFASLSNMDRISLTTTHRVFYACLAKNVRSINIKLFGDDNRLLSTLPNYSKITSLNLFSTRIGDKGLTSIAHCPGITALNLSGTNTYNTQIATCVSKCFKITSLDLSGTFIKNTGLKLILDSISLKELALRRCSKLNLNNAIDYLSHQSRLTFLDISHIFTNYSNNFRKPTESPRNPFTNLTKLTQLLYLNMKNTFIRNDLKYLTTLTQLTYLNLKSKMTPHHDEGLEVLANLTQLTYLNIGTINLTHTRLQYLTQLTQLTYLNIGKHFLSYPEMILLSKFTQLQCLVMTLCRGIAANSFVPLSTLLQLSSLRMLPTSYIANFNNSGFRYLPSRVKLTEKKRALNF